MKLPPEIRLSIYDCLFEDLTINRQREVADLQTYHHWTEWPRNDFTAYRDLLLTCKSIRDEAKSLWEKKYTSQCCLYFWKVPDFYRVATLLTKLGEPYQRMAYVLRTRPFEEVGNYEAEFVDNEAENLMQDQPGYPHDNVDYADGPWAWPEFRFSGGPGRHTLHHNGRIPHNVYKIGTTDRQMFARADFPALDNCSITVHERQAFGEKRTQYLLMTGSVGDVVWGGYMAADGHAQLRIWEEWQRRGYPSSLASKLEIFFVWRAEALSGLDTEWIALGGDRDDDLSDIHAVQNKLQLYNWLR